jgi:Asp-tRNA(Asn)/Glu-tRNA(Gln) amidotransferase A subunit family amidase
MDDIRYMSAAEALERFRAKSLSPLELLDGLIDWIDTVEPAVNAVAERLIDRARRQASAATERYVSRPEDVRPLEGLPVAVKAEQPIEGHPWSDGSLAYAERIADVTHPVVERIERAGGAIHLRTTTPEFSCAAFTHSKLWGVTRNPWNLDYSPGGSSGGSAAALAAGMAPLATGSDIGGSIRAPAAFSGVVGYKPPYGRVPDLPPFNLDAYCHVGSLARSVRDCALLQNAIVGPHPIDANSMRPAVSIPTDRDDVTKLRIAVTINLGDWVVEPEVEANTRAVADALRDAGAVVEEVDVGLKRADVDRAAIIHFSAIFGPMVADEVERHGELLTPYARHFAARYGPADAPGTFVEGLQLEAAIHDRVSPLLERYDALVCPTSGVSALVAGEDYIERPLIVAGQEVDPMVDTIMTVPFNILSRCPVLAVPSGWATNGVPPGVQIVGRTYDDLTVFRIGAALERVRPWGYQDPEHLPPVAMAATTEQLR